MKYSSHLKLVTASFLLATLTLSARAAEVVAEWTQGVGVAGQTANNTMTWGQTFQPTASGTLDTISVSATQYGVLALPSEATFLLFDVNAPGQGTLLASRTVSTAGLSAEPGWLTAAFGEAGISLAADKTYAFSISYEHPNNEFISFLIADEGYSGGNLSIFNGGEFFPHSALSLGFQVRATVVPPVDPCEDVKAENETLKAQIQTLSGQVAGLETDKAALAQQLDGVSQQLEHLKGYLRSALNDANFDLSGSSALEELQSVVNGIDSLNPGHKRAVYRALGGTK